MRFRFDCIVVAPFSFVVITNIDFYCLSVFYLFIYLITINNLKKGSRISLFGVSTSLLPHLSPNIFSTYLYLRIYPSSLSLFQFQLRKKKIF